MVALNLGNRIAAVPNESEPLVWVLHDGKPGMRSQALGLAEATGFRFVEKVLTVKRPWAWLPPQLWLQPLRAVNDRGVPLARPWPDLVIGCGRHSAMPALAVRRASGCRTFAAQIQDPRVGRDEFDLLLVPEHDRLRGPRVAVTQGAIHRVTPTRLAEARRHFPALAELPRPVLAVLVGGANRSYRLGLDRLGTLAEAIASILRAGGGSAVVTPSRRTGAAGIALLRERLAGLPAEIWGGAGDNPYYAYLAVADALLVTADSVSMISEAAATGKPVHVLELDGGDTKFARFHAMMRQAGITRPFSGKIEGWSYSPPDDTARAGALLRDQVLARLGQRRPA
ncbi:MAG: mitochondrial fission ELM1 family protein [Alphaproteobacteria bacterium]|nr:mitochondrial fission ELM1 family protein [Alphaproteobacteria bacterium]